MKINCVRILPCLIGALLLSLGMESVLAQEEEPAAAPTSESAKKMSTADTVTPQTLPGAETFIYREGQPEPMRLHVFKPKNWKAGDKLPALVWFFGGGWTKGSPEKSAGWGRQAAMWGMVGIVPDYRTKLRFGTTPLEAVADARAALHWVEDHAAELGIDPNRIAVGGNSAGGHVALWTAIEKTPPGSNPEEAPKIKPVALILMSPASDTSQATGYTPKRFGANADALSAQHQLDAKMPPMLLFHGDADTVVPYRQSVDLNKKMLDGGNSCEFITVPGGSHNFAGQTPGWKDKSRELIKGFLEKQKLLPAGNP